MSAFGEIATRFAERSLFVGKSGTTSYAEFFKLVEAATVTVDNKSDLALTLDWSAPSFAVFIAALLRGRCVFPGDAFPSGNLDPFLRQAPLLILRTGGSTGRPRHVVHSVERLLGKYAIKERPATRQLVLFAANHIAGLDAFLKAVHSGGSLVVPEDRTASAIARAIEEELVEVLPATPSMLQFLLLSGELQGRDLSSVKIIPHGAEPMPEALRQRVRACFPDARLLQRFGMTELGALPVREDPEDSQALYLEAPNHTWKVEEGELHVWSPGRMLGTLEEGLMDDRDPWFRTGDLAERTKRGSIRILGRRDSLINVGGEKVVPGLVEDMMLELPEVNDAEIFAIPNPMSGQAVAAKIVAHGDHDLVEILSRLRVLTRKKGYPLAYVPTRIEFVTHLKMTDSGKRQR